MRIRMLTTCRGSDDGANVQTYAQGAEYELGPTPRAVDLARAFIADGAAVEVGAAPKSAPVEVVAPVVTEEPKPVSVPAQIASGKRKGR